MRASRLLPSLVLATLVALVLRSQAGAETRGHEPLASAAACSGCHATDAQSRWEASRHRPCTQACLSCHAKDDMAKHHPVGNPVTRQPRIPLPLTRQQTSACFTCHDLANRRHDAVPWKAESLFKRLFHRETQHKTYYLVTRNDRGQLCLACH